MSVELFETFHLKLLSTLKKVTLADPEVLRLQLFWHLQHDRNETEKKNVHSVHQGLWGGITFCIVIFIVAPAAGNASLQHMKVNLLEVIMYCN